MEHLEGKNHKKKESMAKNASSQSGSSTVVARNSKHLYCELCDVVCTCVDTYAAHVRGIKHNKVTTSLLAVPAIICRVLRLCIHNSLVFSVSAKCVHSYSYTYKL